MPGEDEDGAMIGDWTSNIIDSFLSLCTESNLGDLSIFLGSKSG